MLIDDIQKFEMHGIPYNSILLFGCPGSGKGTQGKLIARNNMFFFFSLGELFRKFKITDSLGKIYQEFASSGKSLPDEYAINICKKALCCNVFLRNFNPIEQILVLDGFPRSYKQYKEMDNFINIKVAIYLLCDNDIALKRILHRKKNKSNRIEDQKKQIILNRINEYRNTIEPLIELIPKEKVVKLNSERSRKEIFKDISKHIMI